MWLLDDPSTFVDYSGNGGVASKVSSNSSISTAAALVSGAANSLLLRSGARLQFNTTLFAQGAEHRSFGLEAWVLPIRRNNADYVEQQVLGHKDLLDGITIQGTIVRFTTQYTTAAPAVCSYDLKTIQKAHVVGVHTENSNNLYVNGVLVDTIGLTDEQKLDTFVYSDGALVSGGVSNTQEIAVNGIGLYDFISADKIKANYLAGSVVLPQEVVALSNNGQPLPMCRTAGSEFSTYTWEASQDFKLGLTQNTAISQDQVFGLDGGGDWYTVFPLSSSPSLIYGVMLEWAGSGVTVSVSLDGSTWSAATSGLMVPVVTNNFDGTNQNLHIKVSIVEDGYLESLEAHGYSTGAIDSVYQRDISTTYPSVIREDYEPALYRDDNGIRLVNTTISVGPDTSEEAVQTQTVEFWIKSNAAWNLSATGTQYINGVASSAMPVGEWCLVHVVKSAASNDVITLTADGIVGQMVVYGSALSASQISNIYKSYVGIPFKSVVDTGATITEPAVPANIYAHAWSEVSVS